MQPAVLVQGLKASDFPDKELSIRDIFPLNHNWDRFQASRKATIRGVEVKEARKMLSCRGWRRGCKL